MIASASWGALELHDDTDLRIGGVYLRYFCGPDAGSRADEAVEQLADRCGTDHDPGDRGFASVMG